MSSTQTNKNFSLNMRTMSTGNFTLSRHMEDTIVLYPSPGIGHLVSMVELGKLLLNHQPSFSIIIFINTVPYSTGSTAPYINHISATTPSITFHHVPTTPLPPHSSSQFEDLAFEIPRLNNPNIKQSLQSISQKSSLKAFIIDFFCNSAFEVSTSLKIPTYYFFTSGASALSIFLYLPTLHSTTSTCIKDVNDYLQFPGTPAVHSLDMPKVLWDKNSTVYNCFLNTAVNMAKSSGLIVNSFESFEPRAIKAISDGLCVPKTLPPPVYYIGPLIKSNDQTGGGGGSGSGGGGGDEHECLSWLNSQPSRSVVFLCFGSMGLMEEDQLKEMAIGLEKSGHRFLWVVRGPPTDDQTKSFLEPDLNVLLPKGFLDRTKDRGFVVNSWAPQVAVLSHDSVGGFVTHCGWNSTLEAVFAGVPMVAWPLYAEQRMNRVFLVEELKVALGLNELENGFVSADELEKRVRELMDSESGKAVRDQVMAMKNAAKAAIGVGGSSRVASIKLAELWKQG